MPCNQDARPGLFSRFRRDRRGVSVIVFALSAVVVLGAAGLALDGGFWIQQRRDAQTAADAAAQSGALALLRNRTETQTRAIAAEVAGANGWPTDDIEVETTRVTVVVEAPQGRSFSALFLGDDPVVRARAVAGFLVVGPVCIGASETLDMRGNVSINANGCVIYAGGVNERGATPTPVAALDFSGNALTIEAEAIFSGDQQCPRQTEGDRVSANCFAQAPPMPFPPALEDLLANPISQPAGCVTVNGTQSFNAGSVPASRAFCGSGGTVNLTGALPSGTYYLGNLNLRFSGTVTCNDCTFVLAGNNPGSISIAPGNTVATVRAPSAAGASDPRLAGVAFYRQCAAGNATCAGGQSSFGQGTTALTYDGAVFLPYHDLEMRGTPASIDPACNFIVARRVDIRGTADINIAGCDALGIDPTEARVARLIQ